MIRSGNMLLRAPEMSDVELLYAWENDSALWYLSNSVAPVSHFTLEQYILDSHQDIYTAKQLRLMIVVDEVTVGCIDLYDFDPVNKRSGVGILIDRSAQQQGYAGQALELLIQYAFTTLHLKQLWCSITSDNEISVKLFKSKGFEPCGIRKQWVRLNDVWLDEIMLQLINGVEE